MELYFSGFGDGPAVAGLLPHCLVWEWGQVKARKDKPDRFVRVVQSMFCGGEKKLLELQQIIDEKHPSVVCAGDVVEKYPSFAVGQQVCIECTPEGVDIYEGKLSVFGFKIVSGI